MFDLGAPYISPRLFPRDDTTFSSVVSAVGEQNLTLRGFLHKWAMYDPSTQKSRLIRWDEILNLLQRNRFTNLFSNSQDSLKVILPAKSCHATDSRNALRHVTWIKIQVISPHLGRGRYGGVAPLNLKFNLGPINEGLGELQTSQNRSIQLKYEQSCDLNFPPYC